MYIDRQSYIHIYKVVNSGRRVLGSMYSPESRRCHVLELPQQQERERLWEKRTQTQCWGSRWQHSPEKRPGNLCSSSSSHILSLLFWRKCGMGIETHCLVHWLALVLALRVWFLAWILEVVPAASWFWFKVWFYVCFLSAFCIIVHDSCLDLQMAPRNMLEKKGSFH